MALTGLIIYKAQRSEAEVISQKTTFDRLGSENNNLFWILLNRFLKQPTTFSQAIPSKTGFYYLYKQAYWSAMAC